MHVIIYFLIFLIACRLCWEKFGWGSLKSDELLLPVLREYEKREVRHLSQILSFVHGCAHDALTAFAHHLVKSSIFW